VTFLFSLRQEKGHQGKKIIAGCSLRNLIIIVFSSSLWPSNSKTLNGRTKNQKIERKIKMSNLLTDVLIPANTEDVELKVNELLAPYDKELEVEPYETAPVNQKTAAIIKSVELKFRCPQCGGSDLLEISIWANELRVFMDGGIDWSKKWSWGDQSSFCCAECQEKLVDEDGCTISDYEGIIRWLFERYAEEVIKKNGW
jgi:hypothetical protein